MPEIVADYVIFETVDKWNFYVQLVFFVVYVVFAMDQLHYRLF